MSVSQLWEQLTAAVRDGWAELTQIENQWKNEDPRLIFSILAGLFAAVACCVVTRRRFVTRKKQKEIAIRTRKVIRAKRVHLRRDRDRNESTGAREVSYHGVYEYTVEGKARRYRVHSRSALPNLFLDLYYTDSPGRVFSDYDDLGLGYNLSGVLGIAVFLLAMYLTGYFR